MEGSDIINLLATFDSRMRSIEEKMQVLRHELEVSEQRRRRRKFVFNILIQFLLSLQQAVPERRLWTKIRSSAWFDNTVLQSWNSRDFKENFRLDRSTFDWLCNQLQPFLQKRRVAREPVSVPKQLALTLTKLGSSGQLREVANLFGVARSTTCTIVNNVCKVICSKLMLKFPSPQQLQQIAIEFKANGGIPGCCGAIDGSHIPIKAPTGSPKDYFCRKQFHSIVLQGVADARGKFINATAGWPGSVHDARVFLNSSLYEAGQRGTLLPSTLQLPNMNTVVPAFFVGDAAYPLLTWLMKPYGGALTAAQSAFNYKLSKSRVKIEHAFGMLKGRFRCLLKKNDCNIKHVVEQIIACIILHNICIDKNDDCLDGWYYDDPDDDDDNDIMTAFPRMRIHGAVNSHNLRNLLTQLC